MFLPLFPQPVDPADGGDSHAVRAGKRGRGRLQGHRELPQADGSLIGDAYDIARGKQEADTLLWGEDNVSFDIYDGATRENWSKNASVNGELLAADLLEQVGAGQYDHVVYINGIHMKERLFTFGSGVQEREYDSLWRSPYAASFSSGGLGAESPTIAIAVKARDQMLNYGPVYSEYYRWFRWMMVLSAAGAVAGLALLVLLGTLIAHRTLGAAHRAIASAMGRLWMEVKLLLSAAALGFGGWTLWATFSGELGPAPGISVFLLCFWWCWLVLARPCPSTAGSSSGTTSPCRSCGS